METYERYGDASDDKPENGCVYSSVCERIF